MFNLDPIPGFTRYFINKSGQIFSKKRDGRLVELKVSINNCGYTQVCLYNKEIGKGIVRGLHYWMALTYIPNPNNYNEIDHLDNNKMNNSIENLVWISRADNLSKSRSINFKKTTTTFIGIDGVKYSTKEASEILGMSFTVLKMYAYTGRTTYKGKTFTIIKEK